MSTLHLTTTAPENVRADALIVTVDRHGSRHRLRSDDELAKGTSEKLRALLAPFSGDLKPEQPVVVASAGAVAADVVAFVLLGQELEPEPLRRAVGAAAAALAGRRRIAVLCPSAAPALVAAAGQGARLGAYTFRGNRKGDDRTTEDILLISKDARLDVVKGAVEHADRVTKGVLAARDLVNTPPGDLPPSAMADAVRRACYGTAIRVETMDERKLERMGMGGIIAVGQGSANPPRLVRMSYRPARARAHVALVGKGITFDSGGLSLKPPTAMITMKCDMAGAAAVATATIAIAKLRLPVAITAYLALAENMPSGTAQRPGDVITMYDGTTVEVLNTDAEGRLVLADALVRACEDGPDLLVDVATLTGAQTIALGSAYAGVMANDDEARAQVVSAADECGEGMWPMPLPAQLRPSLDSKVADLANIGERMGGMLTAGLFLAEFVEDDLPWVHIDIAGPAFNEGAAHGYTPVGGTGAAVRTLVQLADDLAG